MTDHIHTCGHHCDMLACIKSHKDTITQYGERVEHDMKDGLIITPDVIRLYMQDKIDELRACFN